jgi:cysteinyl-tRNA synthetase
VAGHQADPELAAASAAFALTDRAGEPAAPLSAEGRALHDRFVAAIDDDLDMPTAIAVVRETLRAELPDDERRWLVLDADLVLGLDLDRAAAGVGEAAPDGLGADEQALLTARNEARAARDWARADALRDQLAAAGVEVKDGPGGTTWRRTGSGGA